MPRGRGKKRSYASSDSDDDNDKSEEEYDSSERSDDEEPPKKRRKQSKNKSKGKKAKKGKKKKSNKNLSRSEVRDIFNENDNVMILEDDENSKYIRIETDKKELEIKTAKLKGKKTKIDEKTEKFKSAISADKAAIDRIMEALEDGYSVANSSGSAAEIFEDSSDEESSDEKEDSSDGNDDVLEGTKICLTGSFKHAVKKMKEMIVDAGGVVSTSVTKDTEVLLVKKIGAQLDSTKVLRAKDLKCDVVTEDWLYDCIAKKKLLLTKSYKVIFDDDDSSDDGKTKTKRKAKSKSKSKSKTKKKYASESEEEDDDVVMSKKSKSKTKKNNSSNSNSNSSSSSSSKSGGKSSVKKIVMKGSAPIDDHFPEDLASKFHVWEQSGGCVWDAMLNQTNISSNNNKFYKLQILESDADPKEYHVWFRWGRVGYRGMNTHLRCGSDTDRAIREFKKKFKDKTVNDWENRDSFTPHAKKYTYIKMDYKGGNNDDSDDSEVSDDDVNDSGVESKLEKSVQDLIQLIFDKNMMEEQMKEIGYDAAKLPLGKIDQKVVKNAYKVLTKIEKELKKKPPSRQRLEEYSSTYYTLVPHTFGFSRPPTINTTKMLSAEKDLVEALSEIEIATKLLKSSKKGGGVEHPIDSHYNQLKCSIKELDLKKDDTAKLLVKYAKDTHGATHNSYSLKVENIWELEREGEQDIFSKAGFDKDNNRMLLWHGSRLTNFVGIISQGLRIAPPEAPVTGYMFGKGVYFADMVSKSANYCWANASKPTGLMLLCEVALGCQNELRYSDYYANELPPGKDSTFGKGRTLPDPASYHILDNGCVVPCGKPLVDNNFVGALLYNEFIVYDTARIRMKYLLKMKFNYGGW